MPVQMLRPNIFDYEDIRKFISDMLLYLRLSKRLSALKISKEAGFLSSSHLRMIVRKQRPLQMARAPRLGKALGLRDRELQFFLKRVEAEITESAVRRKELLEDIQEMRSLFSKKKIEADLLEILSDWRLIALFESLETPWAQRDRQVIAKFLGLSPSEVTHKLELLERAGLAKRVGKTWKKKVAAIESDVELKVSTVRRLYQELGMEALKHIEGTSPDRRDFSILTLPLSTMGLKHLKARIARFRKDVAEILESDPRATSVYQVNLQVFPLLPFED